MRFKVLDVQAVKCKNVNVKLEITARNTLVVE